MIKKRSKAKYPALNPRLNSRVRQEYIDMDYINQLSDEEKQWMNDFMSEWLNAEVGKQDNAEQNRFQNTADLVKDSTDRNNARNRCLYGRIKNKVGNTKLLNIDDALNLVEEHLSKDVDINNMEDALIDYIDNKSINSTGNGNDSGDNSN